MAITYRTSAAGGGTSGTTDRSVTITTVADDLLVVFVSLSGNTGLASTMTDDQGGTYFLVNSVRWSSSANSMLCYVRNTLVSSGTSTVITCNSGSNTAGELVAVACAGSLRAGYKAIRSGGWQANQASSTTPAPVLNQAALTGNMTIAAVASGDTTTTEPTNWTERQDVNQSTPTTALQVSTRDSGFTGTTITFGASQGAVYASFAVELDGSADVASSLEIGAAAVRQKIFHDPNEGSGTGTLTTFGTDLTVTSVANGTDTLTMPSNDMITTDGPFYLAGSNLPGGTNSTTPYYWIRLTATTGKIATTRALAVAGTAVNLTSDGSGTITLVRTVNTQSTGSSFGVFAANYLWSNATAAPTDNKSNSLTAQAGSPNPYSSFPDSESGVWTKVKGAGGSTHTASKTWGGGIFNSDEPTVGFFEIKGAGAIKAATQAEPSDAATVTSNAVSVTGHSILVLVMFGSGPVGQDHLFTARDGYTFWPEASATADTHSNGYIQCWVGWRRVACGGSYTASVSGVNNESGMMWLLGFEDEALSELKPDPAAGVANGVDPTLTPGSVVLAPAPAAATATAVDPGLTTPAGAMEPAPAAAAGTAVDPTLTPGGVTLAPLAADGAGTAVDPTLTPGAAPITALPADATGTAVDPALAAGAVSVAPLPAAATATAVDPALSSVVTITADPASGAANGVDPVLSAGGVSVEPLPAASAGTAVDPTLTAGAVALEPAAASAAATAVDPSLDSPTGLAPDPAAAAATGVDPTLSPGTVALSPDPSAGAATAVDPVLAAGAVSITADAASSAATAVDPSLAAGGVNIAPDPASSAGTAVDPTLSAGGVTAAPDPAAANATAVDPALVSGGVMVPDPAAGQATAVDPTLAPGAVTVAPLPASAAADGVDPVFAAGSVLLSTDAAAATATAVDPALVAGAFGLAPDPADAAATAVDPTLTPGSAALAPAPASAAATAVDPVVANISGPDPFLVTRVWLATTRMAADVRTSSLSVTVAGERAVSLQTPRIITEGRVPFVAYLAA